MCIVDILDIRLLVEQGIGAPGSSDDANIALLNHMPRDFQGPESVPYLPNRVEFIQFRPHNCGFVWNIALRKSFVCRTIDALSRTSPRLREDGYDRYSRETSDRPFPEKFPNPWLVLQNTLAQEGIISVQEYYPGNCLRKLIFRIDIVLELMELLLGDYFRMIGKFLEDTVGDSSIQRRINN